MPRGARPGERRGGRAKGVRNKKKASRDLAIQLAGIEPKAFLLSGLAFYQALIKRELAKGGKADLKTVEQAYSAGREFAKDAAPYCHSRLASIEVAGPDGGPIVITFAKSDADLL